jgi:hypothetical protein
MPRASRRVPRRAGFSNTTLEHVHIDVLNTASERVTVGRVSISSVPIDLRRRSTVFWSTLCADRGGSSPHTASIRRSDVTASPAKAASAASTTRSFGSQSARRRQHRRQL